MPKYETVIFDLDGTLLDTVGDIAYAMNAVLEKFKLPTHSVRDYKYLVGRGLTHLVKVSLPAEQRSEELQAACLEQLLEEYSRSLNTKTCLYSGIAELLDGLAAKKVRLAILSNKAQQFMPEVVEHYLSTWHFEFIYGARAGIPVKPDPTSARMILQELGLAPEQVVYLGDTDVDMQTATGAGLFAVGACWGFRDADELSANGAQLLLDKPQDLLQLFNE